MTLDSFRPVSAVAIGGSAGGIAALLEILPSLPADFGAPVFIILHLSPRGDSLLPEVLGTRCALPVREAEHGEPVQGGVIYCAPPDYHLLVEQTAHFSLSADPLVNFSRPSIDVFFESAADAYGPGLLGVVLTGANTDGAIGLGQICAAGGRGIIQERSTAEAPAMPTAALATCRDASELSLPEIAAVLRRVRTTQ